MSVYCVRLLVVGAGAGGSEAPQYNILPGGTYRLISFDTEGNNFAAIIAVTSPLGVAFPVTYYVSELTGVTALAAAVAEALADFPPPWTIEPQAVMAREPLFFPTAVSAGTSPHFEISVTQRADTGAAAATAALLNYANYLQSPATVQAVAAEPRA